MHRNNQLDSNDNTLVYSDKILNSDVNNVQPASVLSNSSIELKCPINLEPIRLPVITNDGHTYDFEMIASWIINRQNTDPLTRAPITALILNRAFKNDSVVLSHEEKNNIADFCIKLQLLCSNINLSTIISIEGIQELISSKRTSKNILNSNAVRENRPVDQITHRAEIIQEINRLKVIIEPERDYIDRVLHEFSKQHFPNFTRLCELNDRFEEMGLAASEEEEEEEAALNPPPALNTGTHKAYERRLAGLLLIFAIAIFVLILVQIAIRKELQKQLMIRDDNMTNPMLESSNSCVNNPIPGISPHSSKHAFFQCKNSLEKLGVQFHPVMNNTNVILQSGFFRLNHPVSLHALDSKELSIEQLDELPVSVWVNVCAKKDRPISPR